MNSTEYNGWKNRATWNIALWLDNDEALYAMMHDFANTTAERNGRHLVTYSRMIQECGLIGKKTPDGFKFDGKKLDRKALTEVVRDCISEN